MERIFGRLKAVDSADIRPEVSGRITEVRFQDGQTVKAGEILFVIEPGPFEAAVSRAKAAVASDKAELQFAALDQSRNTSLLNSRVIAKRDYDRTNTAKDAATAALLRAEAELKAALIDLDHACVKAPISGRVSRAELTVGNLVGGPSASTPPPLLASIVSNDSIYADFEVDEQTYLEAIRDTAKDSSQEKTIPVELRAAKRSAADPQTLGEELPSNAIKFSGKEGFRRLVLYFQDNLHVISQDLTGCITRHHLVCAFGRVRLRPSGTGQIAETNIAAPLCSRCVRGELGSN